MGTLYLFTKKFPYGNAEQYIVDELKVISSRFDSIIIIPADYFGDETTRRDVPSNTSILDINKEAGQTKTQVKLSTRLMILVTEFFRERDKIRLIKEFKRYWGILGHQAKLGTFFEKYLQDKKQTDVYFYTYWLHHSSIMLGLLKKKGVIKHFFSRAHSIDLFHNDWPFAYDAGLKVLPFQYFKTKWASAIFPISNDGTNYLKQKFPEMSSKFKTCYLGVNDLGQESFQPEGTFTLVSCSSVSRLKRVLEISEIFKKLSFPAQWIHFGDGDEMQQLKRATSNLPSHLKVNLPGYTPNTRVLEFYKTNSVNLFINLSTAEGIPVSIMEASSFGVPCMATRINGNPEALPPDTDLLIDPDFEVEDVVLKIEELAKSKDNYEELRKTTRAHCLKHFQSNTNFTAFADEILNWKN